MFSYYCLLFVFYSSLIALILNSVWFEYNKFIKLQEINAQTSGVKSFINTCTKCTGSEIHYYDKSTATEASGVA